MKSLTLILSFLLITYSAQTTFALTDCEVENDSTTKTTAVITCKADATLAGTTFKDDYLKLQNVTSKTASLATCTNACTGSSAPFTCTITCTKVTGAEAGLLYTLTPISTAVNSNVFSSGANSGDGITLANANPTTKSHEGQAAASGNNNTNTNNNNNNDTSDGNSLKYYLVSLLSLFLF